MIDLHTHSNESDGELTPFALIDHAASIGLKAIALTDHDTVAGIAQAETQAKLKGIRFLPGVEIEVAFNHGEFHLLGLNLKQSRLDRIESLLSIIQKWRATRNQKLVSIMQNDGLSISSDTLKAVAGGEIVGRLHFATWLINAGLAKDVPDSFKKWLGPGCPYTVIKPLPSLQEAIAAIHEAGGKSVIAHPKSLRISWKRFEQYLIPWKSAGLDGIEALHSGASNNEVRRLTELAHKNNLIITGGSDFHGFYRPDRPLGYGPSGMTLSENLLEPFNDDE